MCLYDYLCLGEILLPWVISFGYGVMWWMTSSLYGGHVNLGMIFLRLGWNCRLGEILFVLVSFLHLGAINRILVWFFLTLDTIFILVRFYFFWCCFISWCDQLHLGIIFLHFARCTVWKICVIRSLWRPKNIFQIMSLLFTMYHDQTLRSLVWRKQKNKPTSWRPAISQRWPK